MDEATRSASGKNVDAISELLISRFNTTKKFCSDKELILNTNKAQLMVVTRPSQKIPADFHLMLDGINIIPLNEVRLLGVLSGCQRSCL